jgi:PAS domain S-box-containing protein
MLAREERRIGNNSSSVRYFHLRDGIPGGVANCILVLVAVSVAFLPPNRQSSKWTVLAGISALSIGALPNRKRMIQLTQQKDADAQSVDRELTHAQFHVSEETLSGIVASAMDAIIAINEEQRVVLFNDAAARMFDCSVEDAFGSHINRFVPERFRSNHEKHIRRFSSSGITSRAMGDLGALWGLRSNGEEFPIEASISRIEAGDGKIFTVVIRDITERKLTEESLSNTNRRLIEVQEEERRRIAREIHDDYNQRLAVIAIDLEELAAKIERTDAVAGKKLHQLWRCVSELGGDLHALSHRLHSSTLESLGLVAGVRAFCEEFADQQDIQVSFVHKNIVPGISEDAALCLFRVAQESLRNIKRHSGASRAEVRLEGQSKKLHLSVIDHGRGFNPKERFHQGGIGIRSMEERLRLLGGSLEIHSRPMEGTRVDAWLPLVTAALHANWNP